MKTLIRLKLNSFSVLFILVFIIYSCKTDERNNVQSYTNLTSDIDSIIGRKGFNGVVLLKKDTTTIYSKTFGYSDLKQKKSLQPNDQFVIGSISKQITAVLILREVENGTIALTDTISQYIYELNQSWISEITIHHLLTHTHGIKDLESPLSFQPGDQFQYSQIGYHLLAIILEKVTKKSFRDLSSELFKNYGLTNTFHPKELESQNLINGYEYLEDGSTKLLENSLENYPAAGSFISNADDLATWNQLLHTYQLIHKETFQKMKTPYATREHLIFESVEYGYGLLFKKGEENIQIGALGYAPGFVSASYYYPKSKMNLIVLENTVRNLPDFNAVFQVHTDLMSLINHQEK